jgi:3-isopropylmalate dehydrogenase
VLSDGRAATIDFVLVRESTEGLFAHRLSGRSTDDRAATDLLEVTRPATERVVDFAFRLAGGRRPGGHARVTCIDKANVLSSMAFFRKVFDEVAGRHPGIDAAHMYVDAAALNLVRHPWDFDVMVTENMFGDILSDLGAGLLGGMGLAPSADIGDAHAVFQPCHGSAPDIIGTGKANPIGMFLSAAMMLEWLAGRHGDAAAARGGRRIRAAVDHVFAAGTALPMELGGRDDTRSVTAAVIAALDASGDAAAA